MLCISKSVFFRSQIEAVCLGWPACHFKYAELQMATSSVSIPVGQNSVPSTAVVSPPKVSLVKKVVEHVEKYEMAYKRFRRVRGEVIKNTKPGEVPSTLAAKMDAVLTLPEVFKNTGMRRLVGAAKQCLY